MNVKLREGWKRFLQPHPWGMFLTLTFDGKHRSYKYRLSPERADKDFRRLIRFVNESLYGKRWLRKTKHKGVVWARVQEPHATGTLHYHTCLYSPSKPFTSNLLRATKDWWETNFGMARSEVPKSRDAVVEYLTKHIGDPERAEMELSYNFPKSK